MHNLKFCHHWTNTVFAKWWQNTWKFSPNSNHIPVYSYVSVIPAVSVRCIVDMYCIGSIQPIHSPNKRYSVGCNYLSLPEMPASGTKVLISMVSCQKGPTRHAYAWQIGPFWQDTIDICTTLTHLNTCRYKPIIKLDPGWPLQWVLGRGSHYRGYYHHGTLPCSQVSCSQVSAIFIKTRHP